MNIIDWKCDDRGGVGRNKREREGGKVKIKLGHTWIQNEPVATQIFELKISRQN